MEIRKQDALDYHSTGRKGKIEVVPTKPCRTQWDLSLAYTPGVAEVSDHGQYVEVRLSDGADPQALLQQAAAILVSDLEGLQAVLKRRALEFRQAVE